MYKEFKHKIKDIDEVIELVGKRPRDKKVVMCHGTFDIVHPGHMRHLFYAKQQGDILIASLTTDKHIAKGHDRPYVPQDLRAVNLAAFEMVDYVLVDYDEKPLKNIEKIQPDFFVKGYEYSEKGVHPKTKEEMKLVESYGGEFVFSPGDIVYSSTDLLSISKPKITHDKLITLMDAENLTFDDLKSALSNINDLKVVVIGDTIVDKYSHCTLLGPTTKTPTFSVKHENTNTFIGGAGIVAKHIKSLGPDVTFITLLGDDQDGELALKDLNEFGVKVETIKEGKRPTTVKQRFWAAQYKMLQVDTVDNNPINENTIEKFAEKIKAHEADIVVFSDFRHGIFNKLSIPPLSKAINKKALKVADTQVSNRWGNISEFHNFDLLTPNEQEARFALRDQDSGVRHLAQQLLKETSSKNIILKLGERGILGYQKESASPRSFFHIDSFVEELIDGVGAGDALLAISSIILKTSGNIIKASILGNIAAAIACETEGNVPVSVETLQNRLEHIKKQSLREPILK